MTVTQLLERLAGAFPAFNARAVEAWAPIFRAKFGKREGPHLAEAYTACLSSFDPKKAGKLFPTPPDIETHMPSLDRSADSAPSLDVAGHRERQRRLLRDWADTQGERASKGVRELFLAMLDIALPIADLRAWSANPQPIELTREQIKLAYQRAVTQRRNTLHGSLVGVSADVWWSQVEEIGRGWNLTMKREDWESTAKTEAKKEAVAA